MLHSLELIDCLLVYLEHIMNAKMHNLGSNVNVLRRWACWSDGSMPPDWKTFAMSNPSKATEIEMHDPELVSLLKGTAPASLLANALQGEFNPVAPDPAVRAEETRQKEVQDLFNRRMSLNLTERMHLQRLDPKVYKEAMRQVANGVDPESVEDRRRFELERQRQHAATLAASANHAQVQIRGGASR